MSDDGVSEAGRTTDGSKQKVTRRRRQAWRSWRDRMLASSPLWIVVFLLVGSWILAPTGAFSSRSVEVDEIATRDYVAPRDVMLLDEETTSEKQRRARETVLPVYDFDASKESGLDREVAQLFEVGRQYRRDANDEVGDVEELWERLQLSSSVRLDREQAAQLAELHFSPELEDQIRTLMGTVLRRGVVSNKELLLQNRMRGVSVRNLTTGEERVQLDLYDFLGYPEEVRELLEVEVSRWPGWSRETRQHLVRLMLLNIPTNVSPNLSETNTRREVAASEVELAYTQVHQGQIVARKGDQLTSSQVQILREVLGEGRGWRIVFPLLGNLLLLILVALSIERGVQRTRLAGYLDSRSIGGLFLLLIAALVLVKLGLTIGSSMAETITNPLFKSEQSYAYAIPYAALPLLCSLLYGRGAALLVTLSYAILIGRLMGGTTYWPTLYVLATSLTAVYALDRLKQRSAVTRAGFLVGVVGMVTALMLAMFSDPETISTTGVGFDLLCALAGGLLVAAATSFAVPVLEAFLPITTDIKLLELSDTNLPALRRLAFEAPGSFQHSLMVANLAKAGCERIGANPVLAYTTGLYHDLGKMLRPQYFVENQHGDNPHDRLAPSMSALIIVSHVKDGLELAREYRLPPPIHEAIAQHHGTRKLSFFLSRAQEQQGEGNVDEHKYRYPGPTPQTKEMGVLMFADAVEAASRTLREPTMVQLEALIQRLLDDCVQDGQLDECDLTLKDLSQVAEAFLHVLQTIHHKRIDYPGYDFNSREGAKLRVVEEAGAQSA